MLLLDLDLTNETDVVKALVQQIEDLQEQVTLLEDAASETQEVTIVGGALTVIDNIAQGQTSNRQPTVAQQTVIKET